MVEKVTQTGKNYLTQLVLVVIFSALTIGAFYAAQHIVFEVLKVLVRSGLDLSSANEAIFNTIVAIICYAVALALAVGVPWLIFRHRTTLADVGLQRLPSWSEIGLAPAGLVVYFLTSAMVMYAVIHFFPDFNPSEAQEVGFSGLTQRYEYVVAFLALVVIAPFAEELLFRGYLYGKLKRSVPWWVAAVVTSALFGFAHGQWNVAIDTFVLSMFACILRDICGSLWPSIMLHMLKNGIAYYFLFVNPTLLGL